MSFTLNTLPTFFQLLAKDTSMSNQLTVFNFNNNEVRTILIDDQPWFIAKDVATILGYSDTSNAVRRHCRKSTNIGVGVSPSLQSQTIIIPESDVYRLSMRSNLEGAEAFQDWVVEEVLPTIRKTGSYNVTPTFTLPTNYLEALKALLTFNNVKVYL